jgi:hypothetical protein
MRENQQRTQQPKNYNNGRKPEFLAHPHKIPKIFEKLTHD